MAARTTEWIDPAGHRHTRTSKTMRYTHLAYTRRDDDLHIARRLALGGALEHRARMLRDLIDDPAGADALPGRLYRIPGKGSCLRMDREAFTQQAWTLDKPHYSLPDHTDSVAWGEQIERAIARMESEARGYRDEVGAIHTRRWDTGNYHPFSYGVVGWSQSLSGAEAKRREYERMYRNHPAVEVFTAECREA